VVVVVVVVMMIIGRKHPAFADWPRFSIWRMTCPHLGTYLETSIQGTAFVRPCFSSVHALSPHPPTCPVSHVGTTSTYYSTN
jgi:hypothetical protein